VEFDKVFEEELAYIAAKRGVRLRGGQSVHFKDLFGIALSGGGIRAATLSAGFLEVLKDCGILGRADYISTVSGGGYTGGYIQSELCHGQDVSSLFSEHDINYLKGHGDYLTPGRKVKRIVNELRLLGAFTASLIMNWVWIVLGAVVIFSLLGIVGQIITSGVLSSILWALMWVAVVVLCVHYFLHYLRHIRLWSSDLLNHVEGMLLFIVFVVWMLMLGAETRIQFWRPLEVFIYSALAIGITGFFGNPNVLTMHRFYRDRIGEAFLNTGNPGSNDIFLHKLLEESSEGKSIRRPYPLVNACLNLLSRKDVNFAGVKVSDYFLLSPKFIGSRITGYAKSDDLLYRKLTLATAIAISGAALNPTMGARTNRLAAFVMSILNLQLGYWLPNPARSESTRFPITWWPYYQILQLLCLTDSTRSRVNLSDGGHIENLGVFELLRRRCRLIIALDAGEDPKYEFADLRNLVIRARNELGLVIKFKNGKRPEERIRPSGSSGFSNAHFAIAEITELEGDKKQAEHFKGVLVYVKSSLVAPKQWRIPRRTENDYWSFTYKTSHPTFPHEPTVDQFFDDDQWEAYYTLGRYIAADLVGVDVSGTGRSQSGYTHAKPRTARDLVSYFRERR